MTWVKVFSHLRCYSNLNLPSLTFAGNVCSMHHSMAMSTRACLAQCCNTGREALKRHSSMATTLNTSLCNFGTKRWRYYHSTKMTRVNGISHKELFSIRLLSDYQSVILRRSSQQKSANRNTAMYAVAIAIVVTGLSYAAVPLYRIFCQASGYGGTVVKVGASEKVEEMEPIRERELTIRFNADTSSALRWQFKPQQPAIKVVPGETALAFYTAHNPTDEPVIGIATYNVIPFEAGLYFNKIQCFCFEEQRLNPHEQVDMPVFFYIDPEFDEDPAMGKVDTITLSYTFFESKEPLAPT